MKSSSQVLDHLIVSEPPSATSVSKDPVDAVMETKTSSLTATLKRVPTSAKAGNYSKEELQAGKDQKSKLVTERSITPTGKTEPTSVSSMPTEIPSFVKSFNSIDTSEKFKAIMSQKPQSLKPQSLPPILKMRKVQALNRDLQRLTFLSVSTMPTETACLSIARVSVFTGTIKRSRLSTPTTTTSTMLLFQLKAELESTLSDLAEKADQMVLEPLILMSDSSMEAAT